MKCVVCDTEVHPSQAQYANAWEASRKKSPCCSVRCGAQFNPDVHWIPDPLPEPPSAAEQNRLLAVVQRRLRYGDRPTVVLREMLLAGVNPAELRKRLISAQMMGARSREQADSSAIAFLKGLLGFPSIHSRDKRDPASLEAALIELERWQARARARG